MSLHKKIESSFKESLKCQNKNEMRAYRLLIADMQRRHSLNKEMSDADIIKLIKTHINAIKETEKITNNIPEEDVKLIEILSQYVPKELTESEIEDIIKSNIPNIKELDERERVKNMGMCMKLCAGRADGTLVKKVLMSI